LQVGRTAMEYRLAIAARTIAELVTQLALWLAGAHGTAGVHAGQAIPDANATAAPAPLIAAGADDEQVAAALACWVTGSEIDWNALYGARRPRRIGLPTYPFAKISHWLPAASATVPPPAADGTPTAALPAPEGDVLYFEEDWVEQALPPASDRRAATVLCLASRAATRQAVTRHFLSLDPPVRALFVADTDARPANECPDTDMVVSGDAQSWRRTFDRIAARYGKVDAVFYLWPLEEQRFISDCAPIVSLLQAAAASGLVDGPIFLAAQGDDGENRCHWESWTGFERSAANALANGSVAAVYQVADSSAETVDLAHWVRILWSELQAGATTSSLYRHGVRHGWHLQPVARQDAVPAVSVLRQGGTYLITGGLGGLGVLFAGYLLRTCGANVVLLGRAPLDPARQRKLDEMAGGGNVWYMQADVGDAAGMADCLSALKTRFGALHGVIHAAGVENRESLQATRWADFAGVLAPKVAGTLVIDQLLQDEPIDFLCHFSSSAAILGDLGGCSYAVGNRFQMAHARLRQQRAGGGRTLVINWPLWREGGMRLGDQQGTQLYLGSTGQRLLETEEGLAAFERLLSQRASQCLVMAGDPSAIGRLLKLDRPAPGCAPAFPEITAPAARPAWLPGAGPLAQTGHIEQDLLRLAAALLQVAPDQLALDRNLADFGFDSINLAAFAKALSRAYGVDVLPSVFFSYPTLERLAHYFCAGAAQQQAGVPAPATAPATAGDGIAVIGMSGRFPDARCIDELWRILAEGRSVLAPAPAEREDGWPQAGYRCGFVPGVSEFDSLFFDISPREADAMGPRQRLLLEETWKALEDAGYGPDQLAAACVGTFVGVEEGDYHRVAHSGEQGNASITSNHNGILAGRLAYFLNLNGPALAVNTACSSGLVALHQACQSLRSGECDTAIVAAANLLLTPHGVDDMRDAGMLAPEGVCYVFDTRANGMVPGEAVVVLVLKRAALAQRDGDRIHALIAASGINGDGRTNGITAPNGEAQAGLIKSVYQRHGIDPDRIGHVIAHGTGTNLGDPVEVNALIEAFAAAGQRVARTGYCALTSIKPNVGHTLAASGLLSVVSMIEALRHATIPASLNWERPN
ncbi:type I polyketide synthase, partial [Janthinobacterium sp.]|uniref:type I polyketide synthase n=1 Tax=Janthinobacterium sp. TaxID=1871054 RepID=UPI002586ECD8